MKFSNEIESLVTNGSLYKDEIPRIEEQIKVLRRKTKQKLKESLLIIPWMPI